MRLFDRIPESERFPWKLFLVFVVLVLALYLPLLFLSAWPCQDVASRYAPMAEAFARGDFAYAFHPRCQMLHTTVAGIFSYLFHCSGFMACKLASLLFYILSAFPLYSLCRRIWGNRIACGTIIVFAFCSPIISEIAVSGLRDSAKMLIQTMLVNGIVCVYQERQKIKWYIYTGLACGLGVCIREDLVLMSALALFVAGVLERTKSVWIWRTLSAFLTTAVISLMEIGTNYCISGYAIPGIRYYAFFCQVFKTAPTIPAVILYAAVPALLALVTAVYASSWLIKYKICRIIFATAAILAVTCVLFKNIMAAETLKEVWGFCKSVMNGISPLFFPLAVLGIVVRKLDKAWKKEENLVAALFAVFNISVIMQILLFHDRLYVSARYLITTVPLLLTWSIFTVIFVFDLLCRKLPVNTVRYISWISVVTVILLSIYCSFRGEFVWKKRKKEVTYRTATIAVKEILQKEKKFFSGTDFIMDIYQSNLRPRVFFDCAERLTIAGYLGGCSTTHSRRKMDIIVTRSVHPRTLKKRYPYFKRFRKLGKDIPFRNIKLQVWKIERK